VAGFWGTLVKSGWRRTTMHHSTRTLLRAAVVGAVAIVMVPLVAVSASAERLTIHDARGDMWRVEEGGSDPRPVPQARIGDFVRASFLHSDTRVVLRLTFAELRPTGRRFTAWIDMRDQDHKKTIAGVQASRRDRNGTAWLMTNRGRDIDCAVRHTVSYQRDTVRVGFPRRCLDNPNYLQFRAVSEHVRHNWAYAYLDNPHNDRATTRAWTNRVRRG
jgi:hypothetical protein